MDFRLGKKSYKIFYLSALIFHFRLFFVFLLILFLLSEGDRVAEDGCKRLIPNDIQGLARFSPADSTFSWIYKNNYMR
jgi:hypothetical protein